MKKKNNNITKKLQVTAGVVLFIGLSFMQLAGLTNSLSSRFTQEEEVVQASVVTATQKKTCSKNENKKLVPDQITINKVNIDLPVVSVKMQNGTWVVGEGVANFASETSTITKDGGNVGIFAHDKENGFTKIKELFLGDLIELQSGTSTATYRVTAAYNTTPADVDVFYPTENSSLTLVTCNGIFSDQRYVVKAELVSIDEGNCYE